MSIKPLKTPANKGGDFELVPAGVYLARCFKMIDLGTQTEESKKFGTKTARKIMLYWELLQDDDGNPVTMKDGRPFSISNTYTWSMHKKATLRSVLNAWRGEPFTEDEANEFEISKLLDKFCKLQVVHNKSGDKTYANVGTIMSTNKTAEGVNDLVSFSVDDPDMEVFESLPEWIQQKIEDSPEWDSEEPKADVEIEDVEVKDGKTVPATQPEGVDPKEIKKLPF